MAWSVLKEGWTSEWDKIYITVKYETARSGTQAGIRYRIEYTIKTNYYFGYPLKADAYTKGTKREAVTVKAVNPNTRKWCSRNRMVLA